MNTVLGVQVVTNIRLKDLAANCEVNLLSTPDSLSIYGLVSKVVDDWNAVSAD